MRTWVEKGKGVKPKTNKRINKNPQKQVDNSMVDRGRGDEWWQKETLLWTVRPNEVCRGCVMQLYP